MVRQILNYYERTTSELYVPIKNASWTPTYPPFDTHQSYVNPNDPSNSPNLFSIGSEPTNAGGTSGLSEIVDIGGCTIVEISTPSNWTAASITFMVCPIFGNDSTFNSLRNQDGSEYVVAIAASQTVAINYMALFSLDRFKIRSGTYASPVQQATDAIVTIKITKQVED